MQKCQIGSRVARSRHKRPGIGRPHQLQQFTQLGCAIGAGCKMRGDARNSGIGIDADRKRSRIDRQLLAERVRRLISISRRIVGHERSSYLLGSTKLHTSDMSHAARRYAEYAQ
jgi:hypothetical protein